MSVSNAANPPSAGTVLVVGANGFLGGYIAASLRAHGWRVLRGVRTPIASDERRCDLANPDDAVQWRDALHGVQAVVNAAGILRETGAQTFAAIHVEGPLALARACIDAGVTRFVQISALGVAQDGEFVASKHRFDEALLALPLQAWVLRPSVVYAPGGSYGGTSLLRALAAFPGFQWLPESGQWPIQPVAAEDLGELVARAVSMEGRGVFEVGGPQAQALRDYQSTWRQWLRVPGKRVLSVPRLLVAAHVAACDLFGRGPVGATMWRMLQRGNVTAPDAWQRLREVFGFAPRALADVLDEHPSQVQDRWQAQLYFLAPTLRVTVVALWLLSAIVGFITPAPRIEALAAGSPLQALAPVALARSTAVLDLVLALWLAAGIRPRLALGLMGLSVLAYTLLLGVLVPASWLDPLGGLAKNIIVLPALAVLWVLSERR